MTFSCLLCAATLLGPGAWIRVTYNSSRSNDTQTVFGKVLKVEARPPDQCKVVFRRKDNQEMEVNQEGRLLSYGSHAPITGYAFQYEVEYPNNKKEVNKNDINLSTV